jgi:hypothetical protein
MAYPPETADILKPFDVQLHLGALSTLNLVFVIDDATDLGLLVFIPIFGPDAFVNTGLVHNLVGLCVTDAVNVCQGDYASFVPWYVNSCYARHI